MNDLERDLARYEAGELDRETIERLHGPDVAATLAMFDRMHGLAAEPARGSEAGWESLHALLPEQLTPLRNRHGARRFARTLLAAAAVLLLTSAVAVAAVPGVRHGVTRLILPTHASTAPAPTREPESEPSVASPGGTDQDQHSAGDADGGSGTQDQSGGVGTSGDNSGDEGSGSDSSGSGDEGSSDGDSSRGGSGSEDGGSGDDAGSSDGSSHGSGDGGSSGSDSGGGSDSGSGAGSDSGSGSGD